MDGVCFDMDGVLVDSEDYWMELEREEILPRVVPDEEVPIEAVSGVYYAEQYDMLAEDYDLAVDYDEFTSMYEGAAEEIYGERVALTDGVPTLLSELRERSVPLAMVTSSPPEWYDIVLERFDLTGAFDTVVSAAALDGPGKPEPAVYLEAAAQLGVDPGGCVAVEDSLQGTRSARAAGMTVVGFGVGEAGSGLEEADVAAHSSDELAEILLERA